MIRGVNPIVQALLGSLFTWGLTALGAAGVFLCNPRSRKLLETINCSICGKQFNEKKVRNQHEKEVHGPKDFKCGACDYQTGNQAHLKRHLETHSNPGTSRAYASLGFAAGVMTAASFWSLLAPALEYTERTMGQLGWVPVAFGFALGSGFVCAADVLLAGLGESASILNFANASKKSTKNRQQLGPGVGHFDVATSEASGQIDLGSGRRDNSLRQRQAPSELKRSFGDSGFIEESMESPSDDFSDRKADSSWRRVLLLLIAIVIHNIPEGLVVGVGFGAIGRTPSATFESAVALAIGIGIQNFPEGLAVSLPLAGFGFGKWTSFWYGQLSGAVEPIAAVIGAAAVSAVEPLLPYALSFAAGAMIFVVIDDIIPETLMEANGRLSSLAFVVGFIVMMSMDVGLG